jgi:hypothetical protein
MAFSPSSSPEPIGLSSPGLAFASEPADPRLAFRSALARYQTAKLTEIVQVRGLVSEAARPSTLAAELTGELDDASAVSAQVATLSTEARTAVSLFGLTETTAWPYAGLSHSLTTLGVEPRAAILELLERGLLALDSEPGPVAGGNVDQPSIDDFARRIGEGTSALVLRIHPSVPQAVRAVRPAGALNAYAGPVARIRESDGLEPVLRLGAIWQRIGIEPLRQTQQRTLYKRDQERLEEDPVISGSIDDALEPLPGLPALWLSLARRLGLVRLDPSDERIFAAAPDFWADNAVHLPQMVATSWLGLREWREWERPQGTEPEAGLPLAFLRPAVLLWLTCLREEEWIALDDLAEHLRARNPDWDRLTFQADAENATGADRRTAGGRARPDSAVTRAGRGQRALGPLLLGAGYAFGLVRAAECAEDRRTVVQLTALGRYVLSMGPPPPPRPTFEHFLFVQPNLEVIAYRQGLTSQLVGRLSRFAWWAKIGAALELKLTQESIVFGLEGGLTPAQMLETLTRHSQRPLPTLVADAVGRWASRREQITFYAAATLIEFASSLERDQALAAWEENDPQTFAPVADRFLLVENAQRIPTDRIRTSGARDYRHPPERCVTIEGDGVTLALDATRSDLLIDAELTRIADERRETRSPRAAAAAPGARKYLVSAASLARATELGITPAQIADWFVRRTGAAPPPAIKLLLRSTSPTPTVLNTRRMIVVSAPSPELMDGLLQHPATRPLLGERLGPCAVSVAESQLEPLRDTLRSLKIDLADDPMPGP